MFCALTLMFVCTLAQREYPDTAEGRAAAARAAAEAES